MTPAKALSLCVEQFLKCRDSINSIWGRYYTLSLWAEPPTAGARIKNSYTGTNIRHADLHTWMYDMHNMQIFALKMLILEFTTNEYENCLVF